MKIDPKPDASLSSPVTGALAILGWKDGLTPTFNGHALKLKDNERSRSLAIDPKQESFVLGTEWNIYKFDKQGKPLWRTPTDIVWGVNVTPDQRFVLAGKPAQGQRRRFLDTATPSTKAARIKSTSIAFSFVGSVGFSWQTFS